MGEILSHQALSQMLFLFFVILVYRNYHVFYYLLAGASEEERTAFHLKKPEEYHYLSQVGPSAALSSLFLMFF